MPGTLRTKSSWSHCGGRVIWSLPRPPATAATRAPAALPRLLDALVSATKSGCVPPTLQLDQVDLEPSGRARPTLERSAQLARRPDAARGRRVPTSSVETFTARLESRRHVAAADPNPGHVASRRMNRVEYVNAIQDLLALEVNGAELLPSDMAGLGFDNNADVLSMTPALMARYTAAATKISRAAVGGPDNRPIRQVYSLGFETQDARMSEDMPFGTHGGLSARHVFPLDGEYVFAIQMKGGGTTAAGESSASARTTTRSSCGWTVGWCSAGGWAANSPDRTPASSFRFPAMTWRAYGCTSTA